MNIYFTYALKNHSHLEQKIKKRESLSQMLVYKFIGYVNHGSYFIVSIFISAMYLYKHYVSL